LVPQVPSTGKEENAFLVIASMVGTTVFSGLFILRTTLVKEAGWTINDLKTQNKDALFSGFMIFMVSAAIMAAAAGTLHVQEETLEKVSDMVNLLEPFAGAFGVAIFTLGLIAAGVSSQFPNVTLLPWLLDDYNERKPNMKRPSYRVIVFLISILGLIVPVFHAKPIAVMIASQAFSAIILPATVLCIIYLGNKKNLMKEHKFAMPLNIALSFIFVFGCIMSYMSYTGIFATLRAL
jgi:Mn2+/Fe2+ NRAMP family transporter